MTSLPKPREGDRRGQVEGGVEVYDGDRWLDTDGAAGRRFLDDRNDPEQRPRRSIKLIPFDEITLSRRRRDLVANLVPRVGLTVVWGPPKCGKSFWVFDAAMHIALDWPYRGRRVHAGPVIYCAFEGQSGLEARLEAFRRHFMSEAHTATPFYLQPATLNLVKQSADLIAEIREHQVEPVLIVLDTLNRSFAGSESSDEDMTAYVQAADAIRDAFDCAVVIVHHCGIDGTRPRGHTALTGAVDAQIAIKRDAADNIIATVECAKDGPQGDTIVSRLEVVQVGEDEDGEPIASCVIVPAEGEEGAGRPKVKGAAKIALDLLRRAIDEEGAPAPGGTRYPPGCRTILLSAWRSHCDAGTIAESDKPDSRRKAFVRAVKDLQARNYIGVWADHVWLNEPRRTSRT
jgi:hypothetical protein